MILVEIRVITEVMKFSSPRLNRAGFAAYTTTPYNSIDFLLDSSVSLSFIPITLDTLYISSIFS